VAGERLMNIHPRHCKGDSDDNFAIEGLVWSRQRHGADDLEFEWMEHNDVFWDVQARCYPNNRDYSINSNR